MALDKKVTKKIKKIISKKDDDKYNEFKTEEERKFIKLKQGEQVYDKDGNLLSAKGGEVKKYKKGGSVKKKNKMATTKGWGASRKT